MKAHKPVTAVAHVVVSVLAICGLLAAVATVVALATGVRPVIFLSGSMGPEIEAGALALTVPIDGRDIRAGHVISVMRADDVRVTHRAVSIERRDGLVLLTMRGDANKAPDSEQYDVTAGADRVVWHMNGLGKLLTSLRMPWAIAGAVLLILIALIPRASKPETEPAPTTEGGA